MDERLVWKRERRRQARGAVTGAGILKVQPGVRWLERVWSVAVDSCAWPDQEEACKLRNLDFILKAFGSLCRIFKKCVLTSFTF